MYPKNVPRKGRDLALASEAGELRRHYKNVMPIFIDEFRGDGKKAAHFALRATAFLTNSC
jgi:hypothetical protein